MKRVINSILVISSVASLSSCATSNVAQSSAAPVYQTIVAPAFNSTPLRTSVAPASAWPVVLNRSTTTYTVFAPQSDSWNGHQLMARSAVAVQPFGQPQATYGVLTFSAMTLVDKTTRTVTLAEVKVTAADFPSARSQTQSHLTFLQQELPKRVPTLSLDRLETSFSVADPQVKTEPLNNMPPKIFIATRPAALVYIDGPPAWRAVPGTLLERVINTRMLLLKDRAGQYYLHLWDGYLQAASLDGPWMIANQPPAGANTAEKLARDTGQTDLMQSAPDATTQRTPSLRTSLAPDIFVSTVPGELVSFKGLPEFASIVGTDLLYAANTSANVFKLLTDQQNYLLISGRWYRAASLNGAWQFVPGNQLPRDFANIPDSSPKENVKASVPGTPQAAEALIANSIPQSTAVPRTSQMPDPQIDGGLQLAPIEGTPLHYVVNSGTPIIEVDPQSWYACQNGVWYVSTAANGSWAVAASVPAVIYSIPSTSPLHYLTYVQVYGSTPNEVYEGYTPGYLGTEVADNGTVVYGTGYDYASWIGSVWYGPPITWGCGFGPCWTPWCGWGFDCGFGWGCGFGGFGWGGCFPPSPWWGGFGHWHDHHGDGNWHHNHGGWGNTGGNVYHQHDQFGGDSHHGQFAGNGFNNTVHYDWAGNYGQAYNSRTGQLTAGQAARVQSVSGSAWHPDSRPGLVQHNSYGNSSGANNHGILANGNGLITGAPRMGPSQSWAWSTPNRPNTDVRGGWSPAFQGRTYGTYPPRIGGLNHNFQNYSFEGSRPGNGGSPMGRSGGFSHSFGGFSHGGGGGGGHR